MTGRAVSTAAAVAGVSARLELAALWLAEGAVKVHAGFGAADIGLVVDGAASDPRVPEVFALFAAHVMAPLAGLFGLGIPVLELVLGAGMALGWGTRGLALASSGTLALYWMSDQLILQYPVMLLLGALVLCATPTRHLLRGRRRAEEDAPGAGAARRAAAAAAHR